MKSTGQGMGGHRPSSWRPWKALRVISLKFNLIDVHYSSILVESFLFPRMDLSLFGFVDYEKESHVHAVT